jgi:hypothetical protein
MTAKLVSGVGFPADGKTIVSTLGRILLVVGQVLAGSGPVFADGDVVGIWSSAARTKGGLGPQLVLAQDGNAIHTFGALVDFRYEIQGNQITMTLLGSDRSLTKEVSVDEFAIDGDMLTLNPQSPERKQVMKRAGRPYPGAHPIVGDWTYTHYTGGPALMRYSRTGIVQLSVPFQTSTGTYQVSGSTLALTLRDQKPVSRQFRRDRDALLLIDGKGQESSYLKFEY